LQYDVKDLTREHPETMQYFNGDSYVIEDFSAEPWKKFNGFSSEPNIADMRLYDIQNLCLYKKSVFDTIGYTDVSFYPAYFIDNDYARRIVLSNIKVCSMVNARFFHFWSRVINQGSGGSNHHYFENNEMYYKAKWGGKVGEETKIPELKISSRMWEEEIVNSWRNK
jgi:GT2 family glycosyltransferase